MADIATLTVRINAQTGELTAELKALEGTAKKTFSSLSSLSVAAGVALGTLAVKGFEVVGRYALDAMQDVIALGGTLTDLSEKTGVSKRTLQEWGFAAEQSGSSLEAVAKASTELGRRLVDGSKGTAGALKDIGLTINDLLKLNPEQRFETVAAAIAKIADPAARAAAETALLGRAGVELDPAIQNFAALKEQAQKLGIALSDETLVAANQFGDQMEILAAQGKALLAEFLQPMLPLIAELATAMTGWARDVLPFVRDMLTNLARSFIEFDTGVQKVVRGLAEAADWLPGFAVNQDQVHAAIARANKVIADNEQRLANLGKAATGAATDLKAKFIPAVARSTEETDKAAAAAKKLADELNQLSGRALVTAATDLAAKIEKIGGSSKIAFSEIARVNKTMLEAITIAERDGQAVPALWRQIAFETSQATIKTSDLQAAMMGLAPALHSVDVELHNILGTLNSEWNTQRIQDAMGDLVDASERTTGVVGSTPLGDVKPPKDLSAWEGYGAQVSQSIIGAIQGGGSVWGAAGGTIGGIAGQSLGKSLGAKAAKAIGGSFGKLAGGALGTVIPVLGTIGGELLGSLVGKLFGPSEHSKVNDMRDAFIDAAGGLHQLNVKASESGQTLDALLKAKTVKGFESAVAGLEGAFAKTAASTQALVKAMQDASAAGRVLGRDTITQLSKIKAGTEEGAAAFAFFQGETQRAAGGITTFLENATVSSQASASALTASLGSIFEDLRLQGLSSGEALAALSPAILILQEQLSKAGFTGGEAFASLSAQASLTKDTVAGPLYTAIGGLGQLMTGLANTGRINEEIFGGLTSQVTDTWIELEKMGKGGKAGLQLIQPELQTMWELQQDFGFATDDVTKALLLQAETAGMVGDEFRSEQDKMTKAIETLVLRMGDLVKVLEQALPKAAASGADGVQDALDGITPPTIHVPVVFDVDNPPDFDVSGGGGGSPAVHALTPRGLTGAAGISVNVNVDGERIAEASTRYTGRVLAPYGVGID